MKIFLSVLKYAFVAFVGFFAGLVTEENQCDSNLANCYYEISRNYGLIKTLAEKENIEIPEEYNWDINFSDEQSFLYCLVNTRSVFPPDESNFYLSDYRDYFDKTNALLDALFTTDSIYEVIKNYDEYVDFIECNERAKITLQSNNQ